ncbi:hypothetical protein HDU78_003139 [Chytriomyces hyalinus]|nr:hypothetical protein HDU78_003139 [Chytriomyces hyalinus]KAJ3250049.1 hypothetical protein HDU77_007136 [Chytriomyces hyalinus]
MIGLFLSIASLAAAAPQAGTVSDCGILAVGILDKWSYPVPSDTAASCCSGSLATQGVVTCGGDDGLSIVSLVLPAAKLQGAVPVSLPLLKSLTYLDISQNPDVTSGLQTLAGMTALKNLNIAGTGFTGAVIPFPSTLTCNMGNLLCGDPVCTQTVSTLKPCPSPKPGNNNPADFVAPTTSTVLWILIGVFGGALVLLMMMCFFCNQRGAVASRLAAQPMDAGKGPVSGNDFVGSEPEPSSNEMAMITLSRNGIPKRTFSLPETRKLQSKDEAAMDVAARDPFILANNNQESFPVRRFYAKEMSDELSLTDGDSVVLTKVFRDGWAEGVSMRAGGPALFPLACLGGGVPVVLAERLRVARMMARGGPSA